jgi:hypothetical protein
MNGSLFESLPLIIRHEITQQLHAGHKIEAIKIYRAEIGCDLFTAKQAIEQIEKDLRTKNPGSFSFGVID